MAECKLQGCKRMGARLYTMSLLMENGETIYVYYMLCREHYRHAMESALMRKEMMVIAKRELALEQAEIPLLLGDAHG